MVKFSLGEPFPLGTLKMFQEEINIGEYTISTRSSKDIYLKLNERGIADDTPISITDKYEEHEKHEELIFLGNILHLFYDNYCDGWAKVHSKTNLLRNT